MRALLTLLSLSTVLLGWTWFDFNENRAKAESSVQSERIIEELSKKISLLKDKPKKAMTQEVAITELSSRIESVAQSAGINKESLVLIQPESARETPSSQYLEKPTRVEFEKIELPKLVTFLMTMSEGANDLYCDSLRIKAPPGDLLGSKWEAELTLSYLILKPSVKSEDS